MVGCHNLSGEDKMVGRILDDREVYQIFRGLSCSPRVQISENVKNWEEYLKEGELFEIRKYEIAEKWFKRRDFRK